ncbi:hypothetical protein BDD12DRAFT_802777 [Trichophaea hybrida]|nr:hypothetical protein BDD12DRAFT_802777 [Trichophaea hybrida]
MFISWGGVMNHKIGLCPTSENSSILGIIYSEILFYTPYGIGPLSFGQAKIIDVAYDVIIGRGGQLLLLWIASFVYTAVLNQMLESTKISYDLYISIAISGTTWNLMRGLAKRLRTTSAFWFKNLFMLYSVLYLFAFPTLIAATTSYMIMRTATLELRNHTTINFDYGMWLEAPAMDGKQFLEYNGEHYEQDYISHHCTISYDGNIYIYTLAPIFTLCVYLLQLVWLFGMYGLWVDACRKSQLHQAGRRLGIYRGILDVAEALNNDLGPNACAYSDTELIKEIERQPSTHRLSYWESSTRYQSVRHLTISPNNSNGQSRFSLSNALYGFSGAAVV